MAQGNAALLGANGELLFKVTVDGKEYKIFADGRVRGIEGGKISIVNNFYRLAFEAIAREAKMRKKIGNNQTWHLRTKLRFKRM